jgi:hypothetical protein
MSCIGMKVKECKSIGIFLLSIMINPVVEWISSFHSYEYEQTCDPILNGNQSNISRLNDEFDASFREPLHISYVDLFAAGTNVAMINISSFITCVLFPYEMEQ